VLLLFEYPDAERWEGTNVIPANCPQRGHQFIANTKGEIMHQCGRPENRYRVCEDNLKEGLCGNPDIIKGEV
jgi:hypothetical protein